MNKMVEGSGSRALPNMQGRLWHTGYFWVLIAFFHMCVPSDMPHQIVHTLSYDVVM